MIHTDQCRQTLGAYPHARRVGNLLFLSGIGSGLQLIIKSRDWNWMQMEIL